jgi:hypothetical protein
MVADGGVEPSYLNVMSVARYRFSNPRQLLSDLQVQVRALRDDELQDRRRPYLRLVLRQVPVPELQAANVAPAVRLRAGGPEGSRTPVFRSTI